MPYNRVQGMLNRVCDDLQKEAQQALESSGDADAAIANGSIHALLSTLAEVRLTKKQQQQMETIIDLHRKCLYPRAYRPRLIAEKH